MNNELKNIQAFFTERRLRCLSVSALEREAGLPTKTLAHFIRNRRMLTNEHLGKLIPVLSDFGHIPVEDKGMTRVCGGSENCTKDWHNLQHIRGYDVCQDCGEGLNYIPPDVS